MADEKKNTDRKKALESAILQIEKQFGKGAIMKYGEGAALKNIEVIPTGCLALDIALGIGGIPKGRIIEIYGPNLRVKPPFLFISLQNCKSKAE